MTYTIEKVSTEVKDFNGKFGAMRSYRVKLREYDQPVEIVQKASSPAPVALESITGMIDTSGQYGPKFKKEFNQSSGASGGFRGKPQDSYAMFLSYSKDIAVALADKTEASFEDLIQKVSDGANVLWEQRPDAPKSPDDTVLPVKEDEPVDLSDIPF